MKIFDFNIHLPHQVQNATNDTISNEVTITAGQLSEVFGQLTGKIKAGSTHANIMIFNSMIFESPAILNFTKAFQTEFPGSCLTLLADFRQAHPEDYLQKAKLLGVKFIKFHSYVQKIKDCDFETALKMAVIAQNFNMPICIDASFGTTGMYTYDNLKLAAAIAERIENVPVVILHSGGARVFEAMLIAHEKKNVFLETSFSINYYQGSSIENDFAFAYKKIGCQKVLFGSDFPYVDNETAKNNTIKYLEKNKFTAEEIEKILYHNAMSILNE